MSALKRLGIAIRFESGWRSIQGALAGALAEMKLLCLFLGLLGLLFQAGCGNTVEQAQAASAAQVTSENLRVDGKSAPLSPELRRPSTQHVSRDSGDGDFLVYEYR